MTPRRRAILLVTLALLLIGLIVAIVLWLTRRGPSETAAPAPEPVTEIVAPAPVAPTALVNPLNPPRAAKEADRTAATQMAELFAERYGSYSNQGDFQNLKDLLPIMTASYRAKTEAYLATAEASDTGAYAGVTSVRVSTQVRSYSESAGTAVIAVTVQQQKSAGASSPAISYRSLKLELKKSGQDWKVDTAVWEN